MSEEKKDAPAAAAAPTPEAKKAEPAKKGGGAVKYILGGIFLGAAAPFIYPTLCLFVGMIPTVVALFTESDRKGSSVTAIGAMNVAGITPFVIDLWQKGQTYENATIILSDPQTWLVMFGAAAVGQLILFAVPQAIASTTMARTEARISLLKDHMEVLKHTWGPDVATAKPLEKVLRVD